MTLGKGMIVVVLGLVFALGTTFGMSLMPSPRAETCETLAGGLPSVVPETTILRVRSDHATLLGPDHAPMVNAAFREAVDVLEKRDRLVVDMGELNYSEHPSAHVLLVGVLIEKPIHSGLTTSHGQMCGNLLLVSLTKQPELDRRIAVHEIGHFLGLSHEEGTWMAAVASKGSAATDRFSERQEEILAYWDQVGEPYVPHWVWKNLA